MSEKLAMLLELVVGFCAGTIFGWEVHGQVIRWQYKKWQRAQWERIGKERGESKGGGTQ